MSIHTSQVFEYLDAHPIRSYEGNFESFLASNPIDSEEIRLEGQRVQHILEKLLRSDADALYQTVYDLCFAYALCAFSHGLTVGMHLMTEVNALP